MNIPPDWSRQRAKHALVLLEVLCDAGLSSAEGGGVLVHALVTLMRVMIDTGSLSKPKARKILRAMARDVLTPVPGNQSTVN